MESRAAAPPVSSPKIGNLADAPQHSIIKALFASIFTPTWTSAALLFACFFLPMIRGCGEHVVYPYRMYGDVDSMTEFFGLQFYTWSYWFALLTAAGTLLLVISRNPVHYRTQWWAYALLIAAVTIGLWFAIGAELRNEEQPAAGELFADYWWALAPTAVLSGALVITYFNCRTWFAAALWLRLLLALLATSWFALFFGALMWGGRLSLAACIVLVLATISERLLGLRALGVDPNKLRRRGRESSPSKPPANWWKKTVAALPIVAAMVLFPYVFLSADPPPSPNSPFTVTTPPPVSMTGRVTLDGAPLAVESGSQVDMQFCSLDAGGARQNEIYFGEFDAAASRYQADLPPGDYLVAIEAWSDKSSSKDLLEGRFTEENSTIRITVDESGSPVDIELAH